VNSTPKIPLVAGATGMVGGQLLNVLLDAPDYPRVYAATRRPLGREHPRLAFLGLGREALDIGERRAVDVEHAVELGLDRKVVEPVDDVVRQAAGEELVGLHHLGPVGRWLAQPALAVAADPRRVLELLQPGQRLQRPRARRAVVAAEEPAVHARIVRVREHGLERRQVPVDVVEHAEHAR
jgi:hypothetical protein